MTWEQNAPHEIKIGMNDNKKREWRRKIMAITYGLFGKTLEGKIFRKVKLCIITLHQSFTQL